MNDFQIIQEFQRRRKAYLRASLPGMLLAVVGLGLCIYATGGGGEASPEKFSTFAWGMAAAFAGGIWAFILACIIYRCPVCNAIPLTAATGCESDNAVDIFPKNCRKCGARLNTGRLAQINSKEPSCSKNQHLQKLGTLPGFPAVPLQRV